MIVNKIIKNIEIYICESELPFPKSVYAVSLQTA